MELRGSPWHARNYHQGNAAFGPKKVHGGAYQRVDLVGTWEWRAGGAGPTGGPATRGGGEGAAVTETPIVVLVLAAIVVFVVARTAIVVPQQSAYVVERLGRYSNTLRAGSTSWCRSST